MNKLPKEKRDRLILVGLGTAGLLGALYFLVISSQNLALNDYAEKTQAAKEKLTKAERWLRMAPGVQSRLDSARKELDAKQEGMAPLDKFKWFYDILDKFMAQHQVKLTDITREPEVGDVGVLPKFPYQAATFGVKLNARYDDFGSFLADFENEFPYMRVKNLEIIPEGIARFGTKDGTAVDSRLRTPEGLAISMRVVTLIKPAAPL
jgi:hypothetical protein